MDKNKMGPYETDFSIKKNGEYHLVITNGIPSKTHNRSSMADN